MTKRVLLIGWDGADWKVAGPLMDAGKMPHLQALVERGVMGNLATLSPALSPMLWTSIATGKRPFKHGVLGFTEPHPQGGGIRPVSNLSRKTRALWNMLHLKGKTSNVLGWWPSHPVEPIRGVMVSNHYQRATAPIEKPWPMQPGTVHPKRLQGPLSQRRMHPQQLGPEHILPFVPRAAEIDQEKDRRLVSLAKIVADCSTIQAAATALIQLEPWDFMAVYYDAIDHFGHGFMRYHPPRMPGVSEADFDLYREVVEGGYRFHDMMLGVLLEFAGPDTTIILLSDHGFHPDHLRPRNIPHEPAGPAVQHRQHGMLVIAGPGIKQDERIYGANLLDITPTVLHLFDLPVGEDMDGQVLVNAFAETRPIKTIPSWDDLPGGDGRLAQEDPINPVEAQEAINQLVALGYIAPPDENQERAVAHTVRELRYNEARAYMDAQRYLDAVALLEPLVVDWPNEYRFAIQLITCYQGLERLPEARHALEDLLERRKENAVQARLELKQFHEKHRDVDIETLEDRERHRLQQQAADLQREARENPIAVAHLWGIQLLAEGDPAGALRHFQDAEASDTDSLHIHIEKGKALLALKRTEHAEASFSRALKIDPESIGAHFGLCRSLLQRRQNLRAAEVALDTVNLLYFNPKAHYLLGVALQRIGRVPRAIEAFKVCLAQHPNHVAALERLEHIYRKRVKNPDVADDYRRMAVAAKQRIRDLCEGKVLPDRLSLAESKHASDLDVLPVGEDILTEMRVPLAETMVVVSGLPRSGTSMMMQMLKAGGLPPLTDEHRPPDTHNERGYFEYAAATRLHKDTSWLDLAQGKAVKVVAQLLPSLPPQSAPTARLIFMQRDIQEVVGSQRDMLQTQGQRGADIEDHQLGTVFTRQLGRIKKLLAVRQLPTLFISHRECIEKPTAVAVRINAFLGGTLKEQAMAAAVAPDLYRHRFEDRRPG